MQFRAAWVTTLSITALPLRHPVSGLLRDSHTFLQSSSSSLATPRNHCLGKCRITTIFRSILRLSTRSRFSRTNVHYSECTLKFLVKSNQPFCSPHPLGPILFPSKILSSPLGRIVREHHPRFHICDSCSCPKWVSLWNIFVFEINRNITKNTRWCRK